MARLTGPGGHRVWCLATQGTGSNDDRRIRRLLEPLGPEAIPFDRARKLASALALLRRLVRERPDLVVMEGTGVAGGLALIAARTLAGVPYVVSSGDAVAPFIASLRPWLGPPARGYERLLCRRAAGFIGWTPYLAGRALTLGAPRAMTAPGWAAPALADPEAARREVRERLGIPAGAVVFGIVGSLSWHDRLGYCYGAELVEALRRTPRDDLRVLVVGDGSGLARLRVMAADLGDRVVLPGRVPREDVPAVLAAIDVGSLPQTVDGVGSFRYTTKISEYLGARLPIVTGRIPLAYDLDDGWLWRLPGSAPWSDAYLDALAALMARVTTAEVEARRAAIPEAMPAFDFESQRRRACAFVMDLLEG